MAGKAVFAERQQIGEIGDLAGALEPQRQASLRRHGNAHRGGQHQRRRAAQFELVAFDAVDPAVHCKLASVPGAAEVEPERRQPLLFRQCEAQLPSRHVEPALGHGHGAAQVDVPGYHAADLAVAGEPGRRNNRQVPRHEIR